MNRASTAFLFAILPFALVATMTPPIQAAPASAPAAVTVAASVTSS